jgi:sarcosine oxidase subunit beta
MASPSSALVLGAGIMGLSAAWALARQGTKVTLVEQDPVPNPRGASVDRHRLIRHAYGSQPHYMRMVDPAFAAWETLWAEAGERLFVETGVLGLADAPGGWLGASRQTLAADGRHFEPLDAATVEARYPMLRTPGLHSALHLKPGGVLLADRIVAALAALCARRGVTMIPGRAEAVDPARGALTLSDGRRLAADVLVVAAGPWAPRLLPGIGDRVAASRQILVMLEPPAEWRAAWAGAPMVIDLAEDGGFYAVPPVAGTPLKVGDHKFSLQGDAEADPREATAAEAEAILAFVRPRLRDAGDYRVLGARACYYDVSEGERFLVEPLGPRAWVMSGFSGHGFKFGPLLGLALARALAAPDLAAALPAWAAGEAAPPPGLLSDLEALPA